MTEITFQALGPAVQPEEQEMRTGPWGLVLGTGLAAPSRSGCSASNPPGCSWPRPSTSVGCSRSGPCVSEPTSP
ncbi:hypothetical protein G7085_09470 [Tessaracoccus sp. HDW20]|uniref:hypothetical protein n=1 Tax=Tessaracoccus coleopterorum TaxID=2714950 RepID=UPI0018D3328E|nr:hypothetical protein [Tessaracoccus coleopterorum]NHB84761.1 hypothetical protein [Tessaracoccus coleopterorum]